MKTSEPGLLNSSMPFWRFADAVLPSFILFGNIQNVEAPREQKTHKTEVLDLLTN